MYSCIDIKNKTHNLFFKIIEKYLFPPLSPLLSSFTAKFVAGIICSYHPVLHFSGLASAPLTLEGAHPPTSATSILLAKFIYLTWGNIWYYWSYLICSWTTISFSWLLRPQHLCGFPRRPPLSFSSLDEPPFLWSSSKPRILGVLTLALLSSHISLTSTFFMSTPLPLMTPSHLNSKFIFFSLNSHI